MRRRLQNILPSTERLLTSAVLLSMAAVILREIVSRADNSEVTCPLQDAPPSSSVTLQLFSQVVTENLPAIAAGLFAAVNNFGVLLGATAQATTVVQYPYFPVSNFSQAGEIAVYTNGTNEESLYVINTGSSCFDKITIPRVFFSPIVEHYGFGAPIDSCAGLTVNGDVVYTADDRGGGLGIVNATTLEMIGKLSGFDAYAVTVAKQFAYVISYVATNPRLAVVDITSLSSPQLSKIINMPWENSGVSRNILDFTSHININSHTNTLVTGCSQWTRSTWVFETTLSLWNITNASTPPNISGSLSWQGSIAGPNIGVISDTVFYDNHMYLTIKEQSVPLGGSALYKPSPGIYIINNLDTTNPIVFRSFTGSPTLKTGFINGDDVILQLTPTGFNILGTRQLVLTDPATVLASIDIQDDVTSGVLSANKKYVIVTTGSGEVRTYLLKDLLTVFSAQNANTVIPVLASRDDHAAILTANQDNSVKLLTIQKQTAGAVYLNPQPTDYAPITCSLNGELFDICADWVNMTGPIVDFTPPQNTAGGMLVLNTNLGKVTFSIVTGAAPTPIPPTPIPSTLVPPTPIPTTSEPPTPIPTTLAPPTPTPTILVPPTLSPLTSIPSTSIPSTTIPTTPAPVALTPAPPPNPVVFPTNALVNVSVAPGQTATPQASQANNNVRLITTGSKIQIDPAHFAKTLALVMRTYFPGQFMTAKSDLGSTIFTPTPPDPAFGTVKLVATSANTLQQALNHLRFSPTGNTSLGNAMIELALSADGGASYQFSSGPLGLFGTNRAPYLEGNSTTVVTVPLGQSYLVTPLDNAHDPDSDPVSLYSVVVNGVPLSLNMIINNGVLVTCAQPGVNQRVDFTITDGYLTASGTAHTNCQYFPPTIKNLISPNLFVRAAQTAVIRFSDFFSSNYPLTYLPTMGNNGAALPEGFVFNPISNELTITPTKRQMGTDITIKVMGIDPYRGNAVLQTRIVVPENEPPYVDTQIPDQTAVTNQNFRVSFDAIFKSLYNYSIACNAFIQGTTQLPDGLKTDSCVLSGLPAIDGKYVINVTGTDPVGSVASTTFNLDVSLSNWDRFQYWISILGIPIAAIGGVTGLWAVYLLWAPAYNMLHGSGYVEKKKDIFTNSDEYQVKHSSPLIPSYMQRYKPSELDCLKAIFTVMGGCFSYYLAGMFALNKIDPPPFFEFIPSTNTLKLLPDILNQKKSSELSELVIQFSTASGRIVKELTINSAALLSRLPNLKHQTSDMGLTSSGSSGDRTPSSADHLEESLLSTVPTLITNNPANQLPRSSPARDSSALFTAPVYRSPPTDSDARAKERRRRELAHVHALLGGQLSPLAQQFFSV